MEKMRDTSKDAKSAYKILRLHRLVVNVDYQANALPLFQIPATPLHVFQS